MSVADPRLRPSATAAAVLYNKGRKNSEQACECLRLSRSQLESEGHVRVLGLSRRSPERIGSTARVRRPRRQ